jgi:hypothetical protein
MTECSIEYFTKEWRKLSVTKLRKKLGQLQYAQAWQAVELIKSIIKDKRTNN